MFAWIVAAVLFSFTVAAPCCNKQPRIDWKEFDERRLRNPEVITAPPKPTMSFTDIKCRNGWVRFKESCYYIERDQKVTMEQAEKRCLQKDATLFVPNDDEEFGKIMMDAPFNDFTWVGLFKKTEDEKAGWHVTDSAMADKLNWLVKPYADAANGWSSAAQCAAHWNPSLALGKYTFWYPCNYQFYFVCERNSTLTTSINHLFP